jgi:GNAT superfamily N-acetyltransferase
MRGHPVEDRHVALTMTTDHEDMAAVLDELIAADPVRGTVLGTVRLTLSDSAWCACSADRHSVAARSAARWPIALAGPWSDAELLELAGLLGDLPDVAGVSGAVDLVERVVPLLPDPVTGRMSQRLFRLDALTSPAANGRARRATPDDYDVVLAFYRAFGVEAHVPLDGIEQSVDEAVRSGGCWLWLDEADVPVSIASRRPVVFGSARVGPVYTPPEARGHGYGSAVTAAATRDILDSGAIPVLFTDLSNAVSNAIYPRLGYYPVEDRLLVRFT